MSIGLGSGLAGRARAYLNGVLVVLLVGNIVALTSIESVTSTGPAGEDDELAAVLDGMGDVEPPPPEPPPTSATTTTQAPAQGKGESTTTTTAPPATGGTGYTYEVTLEPLCVVIGQDLNLRFRTEPGAAIGVIVAYADGQTHESRWAGNAGPDGRAVRTWKAPPAPGWAKLLTGVVLEGGRSGGTPIDFQIVEIPGTCS